MVLDEIGCCPAPLAHEEWLVGFEKSLSKNPIFFEPCGCLGVVLVSLSGQNFGSVTGHPPTGRCQKFVHLVTGHTPPDELIEMVQYSQASYPPLGFLLYLSFTFLFHFFIADCDWTWLYVVLLFQSTYCHLLPLLLQFCACIHPSRHQLFNFSLRCSGLIYVNNVN